MLPRPPSGGRTPYKAFKPACATVRRMARRDRGALVTRGLLGAGLLLLGIVIAALALRSPSPKHPPATTAAAPPPATTTAPATTQAPPPSPVQVTSVTPFSATISWRTDTETTGRLAV
jgi:hypothetical protein